MNFSSLILISCLSLGVSYIVSSFLSLLNRRKRGQSGPPGPYGIPLLGYLPFLGPKPYETFCRLAEKYGNVFQIRLGKRQAVVINDLKIVRETFGKDLECAGRPDFVSFQTLIKTIQEGVAFDPKPVAFKGVSGVISAVLFGGQYDPKDPLLAQMISLGERVTSFIQVGSILDSVHFGAFIMHGKIQKFESDIEPLIRFTETAISNHECSDDVKDIADALQKVVSDTPQEEKTAIGLSDIQIKGVAQDLFAAGFVTTMETFRWAINLLSCFPDKQEKLQEELDSVLEGRWPTLRDRDHLPYCESVLLEVFRFSSLVPLGIPHATLCDTKIGGYFVPKGTLIYPNFYSHHYNPNEFENPREFRPERFLSPDGSLDTDAAQTVVPFSTGKRRCVGENLARQELALLIAGIFQKFQIRPAKNVVIDPFHTTTGFTRGPIGYDLVFTKRT